MSDAPTHPYVTVMPARYASLERVEVVTVHGLQGAPVLGR